MICEHEYVEREVDPLVGDGYRELVCIRCDDYRVALTGSDDRGGEREVKGGTGG